MNTSIRQLCTDSKENWEKSECNERVYSQRRQRQTHWTSLFQDNPGDTRYQTHLRNQSFNATLISLITAYQSLPLDANKWESERRACPAASIYDVLYSAVIVYSAHVHLTWRASVNVTGIPWSVWSSELMKVPAVQFIACTMSFQPCSCVWPKRLERARPARYILSTAQ